MSMMIGEIRGTQSTSKTKGSTLSILFQQPLRLDYINIVIFHSLFLKIMLIMKFSKIDKKLQQLEMKVKVLRNIDQVRQTDMQKNYENEMFKFNYKRERLIDREIKNRERVKRMALDREKAIQNQMEINKIVQEQAQQVSFGG